MHMTSRIVIATGPSLFSVLFENGRTKEERSNILVFVANPQFVPPPSSISQKQSQVLPIVLPPRSIAIPAQTTTSKAPAGPLEETIPTKVLVGTSLTNNRMLLALSLLVCLLSFIIMIRIRRM